MWRLYPQNSIYHHDARASAEHAAEHKDDDDANVDAKCSDDEDVELHYDDPAAARSDDDDDAHAWMSALDPSVQSLSHLVSLPASGEVKALCMSASHGGLVVASSSRSNNEKASLDILALPHWTWNYASAQRLPHRVQQFQDASDLCCCVASTALACAV